MRRLRQWWANRVSHGDDPMWRLYREVVEAGVAPARLALFGLKASPETRFEMVALHMAAVWHRLDAGDDDLRRLRRGFTSAFVADMDASLRDMGAGDLGVGKRVKVLTERLYGRLAAYAPAFEAGADVDVIKVALLPNLYKEDTAPGDDVLARVCDEVAKLGEAWRAHSAEALKAGEYLKAEL